MTRGQKLERLHSHPHFKSALMIVKALRAKGFQAVFAGGCVRDALLGRELKDIDIATSAHPEVVEATFARTLAVGKAFGTIVVVEDQNSFEVTTFRRDGDYLDGRHPESVEFSDMEEDAKRRDFTVNALFYDPLNFAILDYVSGIEDLEDRFLRTVGDAHKRFNEDRLRMLRAVRFVGQLGFALDEKALTAIQALAAEIGRVSIERVFAEMKRLLESPYLSLGLQCFRDSDLDQHVWPEVVQLPMEKLKNFSPFLDWENAFAAIMLLCGHERVDERLRAWKAPRDAARNVRAQIDGCRTLLDKKSSRAEKARVLGGNDFAGALILARGYLPAKSEEIERSIEEYLQVATKTGELPKAFVNGEDLLRLGFKPGAEMGQTLKKLFDLQLEGQLRSKEEAVAILQR